MAPEGRDAAAPDSARRLRVPLARRPLRRDAHRPRHRLCQRQQPVRRARGEPPPRAGDPHGHRRAARSDRSIPDVRSPHRRIRCRDPGSGARVVHAAHLRVACARRRTASFGRRDLPTLGFTFALALVAGLACGLAPALRSSSARTLDMRGTSRSVTGRRRWERHALLVGQTALAIVLMVGAGLLMRSYVRLSHLDPGYSTRDLYTFQFAPDQPQLNDGPAWARFHLHFMERLWALPGVQAAASSTTCRSMKPPIPRASPPMARCRRTAFEYRSRSPGPATTTPSASSSSPAGPSPTTTRSGCGGTSWSARARRECCGRTPTPSAAG